MRYTPKTTTPATVFGAREAGNFSIAVNGKMFNVLIDGLYTNKIESIVREACANARDGHLKRGNLDTAFLVHAPSTLEPWFSVRDYGCSMDHEMVMTLYTTLGWSSKEDSDTMVGCFGLGSKAPFAYAETFSVTTFLDGRKRIYVCYMDDDDQPKIILSDEMETDEETGVEVSIPVKEADFRSFKSAIRRVVLGYETPFTCPGVDLPKIDYVSRSETFDVVARGGTNYGYLIPDVLPLGPYARIGVVLYPIDHNNETFRAALEERDVELRKFISNQTTGDLIINIPISVAAVTPSREFLSYTKAMIDTIVDVYEQMFKRLKKEVEDLYEGCSTKWEYATKYWEIHSSRHKLSSYAESKYGSVMTGWGAVSNLKDASLSGYYYNSAPVRNSGMFGLGGGQLIRQTHVDRGRGAVLIVGHVDKIPTHAPTRVLQYIKNNGHNTGVLVRLFDIPKVMKAYRENYIRKNPLAKRSERKTHLERYYASIKELHDDLIKFIEDFDCPNVVSESDLPYAKIEKTETTFSMFTTYEPRGEDEFTEVFYGRTISDWKTRNMVVVPLTKRSNTQWIGGVLFTQRMLQLSGVNCDGIIAVSVSNLPEMRKHFPHWVMIEDALVKINVRKIQDVFDSIFVSESFNSIMERCKLSAELLKDLRKPPEGTIYAVSDEVLRDVDAYVATFARLTAEAETYKKKATSAGYAIRESDAKNFIKLLENYGITGLTPAQSTKEYGEIVDGITAFRDLYPEIDNICRNRYWGLIEPENAFVIYSYLIGRRGLFSVSFDPKAPEPEPEGEPSQEIA